MGQEIRAYAVPFGEEMSKPPEGRDSRVCFLINSGGRSTKMETRIHLDRTDKSRGISRRVLSGENDYSREEKSK
jgi:hypothetical protein